MTPLAQTRRAPGAVAQIIPSQSSLVICFVLQDMAPFKVIVVGGGPNGITLSHALHHAGIDFVVLERRENVFEDTGASLVLSPHNLRVFHQLGILENVQEIGAPFLHISHSFTPKGQYFSRTYGLSRIRDNHGTALLAFHRARIVREIYDGLPDEAKDRYFTNRKLVDISISDTGVEVTCEDGSSYTGTIVIGADGVHSKTRSIMRRLALEANPALEQTWDPEVPFPSHYKCLWASFTRDTEVGESYETQGHNRSAMYLTGLEKGWIFLYEKLPKPTTERAIYDKEAVRAFAESFADWQVHEKLTIRDIINKESFVSGMANLQEGVAQKKSWAGRIVLVGDACHRFTPNAGLGFNSGVQDVVSLSNKLQALINKSPSDVPDAEALEKAFQDYQQERKEPLAKDYQDAAAATRLQAWASWTYYILARYIFSFRFVRNYLANTSAATSIKGGRVLDFIPAVEPFNGRIPWDHKLKKQLD
ncbi:hypothetical protein G7Z17_g12221 [Cylindrodendrum hubeiense]|uniref:FAD-binding domain-containing protein n=1 Tax=Cylindrodendrum hubeiense TaxID=595255 RepID=A0A9P5GVZ8_9HYPO|nr:hypothetical protein G7Z17_g12221 [Cylindrodendrum hubeiense]